MARNFHRGPASKTDLQSGVDMEAEMRRLVAEKVALSVSRGSSPRGAYGTAPKSSTATTKMQLWGMGSATVVSVPVLEGDTRGDTGEGLHHHAFPRGAHRPPPPPSTQDGASSLKSKSSHDKKMLENFGIYPAENKLGPGKSAADEFVASIAKRFQLGRKNSVSSSVGRSISTMQYSMGTGDDAASYKSAGSTCGEHPASASIPEESPSVIVEPPRSAARECGRGGEEVYRLRARSRSMGRKGPKILPLGPSNEGVYATMPLPAVPPLQSFQSPSQIILSAGALAAKTRQGRSRGIDIAEWTESVSPQPPSTTTASDSPLTLSTDRRQDSHSSSSSIKWLSFNRPTSELQTPAFPTFTRGRKHSKQISVSSTGSNVAFPHAYARSESENTGSSSTKTERTSQLIPQQPASPPQTPSQGGFYGEPGDDISLDLYRDSDEDTLHLPDTLDEILDKMDFADLESSVTTEIPQDDGEEESDYYGAAIYDDYTRASLILPKSDAYEWKDRRCGSIFMEDSKPPTPGSPVKTGLDAEIEAYLAERKRLLQL